MLNFKNCLVCLSKKLFLTCSKSPQGWGELEQIQFSRVGSAGVTIIIPSNPLLLKLGI